MLVVAGPDEGREDREGQHCEEGGDDHTDIVAPFALWSLRRCETAHKIRPMREVRPGVWHWEVPHPEWKPGMDWPELVSSYAVEHDGRLLLFDPLAMPPELAAGREVAIVLTCPWHARDGARLAEELGAPLFAPPPEDDPLPGEVYRAGDHPAGVEARPGLEPSDLVLWIEAGGLLVAGDTLIDRGHGLEVPSEWARGVPRERILEDLRPLLELPVELVLPTHGAPADRAALERALSGGPSAGA